MASLYAPEDPARAAGLLRESATLLAATRAWPDLVTVLGNLGAVVRNAERVGVLAQGVWVATLVAAGLEATVSAAVGLAASLGVSHDAAPLLASFAAARIARHPEPPQELRDASSGLLGACMSARSVAPEQAQAWLDERRLLDFEYVTTSLRKQVAGLVPDDAWLFDRTQLGGR